MITLQFWQAISIFVVAVLLGGAMGWLLALRQGGSKAQHDARALEREFDQYRDEVSSHFVQTSELVGRLSESYRDVFDHLAHAHFDSQHFLDIRLGSFAADFHFGERPERYRPQQTNADSLRFQVIDNRLANARHRAVRDNQDSILVADFV